MSGSYYALNSKYNQLLALINALTPPSGSVSNPMTSDLDGGGFNILNVGTSTADTVQTTSGGNMYSNGYFSHGGAGATDFGVAGTDITLAPSNTITVKDAALANTYFEYDQATQTLETKNGGKQVVSAGSTLDVNGGDLLMSPDLIPTTVRRELCELYANNGTYLQHYSENYGNPGAVVVSTSSNTIPFYCPDVGNAGVGGVTFNAGTSWDSTSDGLSIRTWLFDPTLSSGTGTIGVGQAGDMRSLYAGATTGAFCKVDGLWSFAGGATVRLEINSLLPGPTFTNIQLHSEVYPSNRWVQFIPNTAFQGGQVRLVLNIPAGGTIDTNGFNFFDGYKCNITNITC